MLPSYLLGAAVLVLAALLILQHLRVRKTVDRLIGRLVDASGGRRLRKNRPQPVLASLDTEFTRHLRRQARLEGRISRREQLLEVILDSIRDAVLVVDRKETIRFANARAIEFLAADDEPVGQPARKLLLDIRLVSMMRECSAKRQHLRDTLVQNAAIIGKERDRVLEVEVSPLVREDKDRISRTAIVIRNVTARHELEQVRRDFVANASHELRTPLSIINGYLETLIDDDLEDRDTAHRFIKVMKKHGDRLARIIEDMLAISKLESGPTEVLQMEAFDLKACVREVLGRLAPVFEERRATSTVDIPDGPNGSLYGDRFYWDQILFNLIENALKENDDPGLEITVRARPEGEKLVITVADDGIGIPQEDLPFIFKRFYRVAKHHSQEKKGTGLGLSIVKRAVEAHGGRVEVRSTPGRETAFVMRVPRATQSPEDPLVQDRAEGAGRVN